MIVWCHNSKHSKEMQSQLASTEQPNWELLESALPFEAQKIKNKVRIKVLNQTSPTFSLCLYNCVSSSRIV